MIFLSRTILGVIAVGAVLALPPAARAAAPDALAKGAGCPMCHAVDHKLMGPSYHDIAAKYKADPAAIKLLAAKVRAGGKGVWGALPMPAQSVQKIGDADLAAVIGWILKQ